MKIKTLAISLALILGVISTAEVKASVSQEATFSHPESSLEKEQHMSAEKSFVDENRPDAKKFSEANDKLGKKKATDSNCGWVNPGCASNVKISPGNENLNSQ